MGACKAAGAYIDTIRAAADRAESRRNPSAALEAPPSSPPSPSVAGASSSAPSARDLLAQVFEGPEGAEQVRVQKAAMRRSYPMMIQTTKVALTAVPVVTAVIQRTHRLAATPMCPSC